MKSRKETVYVAAGFWIRLLARIIDNAAFVIFLVIFISSALLDFKYRSEWLRVVGALGTIVTIYLFNIMPLYLKSGQTLGKKILGIKVIAIQKHNNNKYIWQREIFYSFLLMVLFVLFFTLVGSNVLYQLNKTNNTLSAGEQIMLNLVLSCSSFWWIFIIACALIMVVRKDKKTLADLYSHTMVIVIKKTHEVRIALQESLKPIPAKEKKKVEVVN